MHHDGVEKLATRNGYALLMRFAVMAGNVTDLEAVR